MYQGLIPLPLEDTSIQGRCLYASNMVHYYFSRSWYQMHGYIQSPSPVNMCYNSDFMLNSQSDTIILGYAMYEGRRSKNLTLNCIDTSTAWLPLPLAAIPTMGQRTLFNLLDGYKFDLNPNNNLSVRNLVSKDSAMWANSNFNSFELFVSPGDIEDEKLPNIINTRPPSGGRAIKINNSHIFDHTNKLVKHFIRSANENKFSFSYAVVLEDPFHQSFEQPYFTARLKDSSGRVLSNKCYISKSSDQKFWDVIQKEKSTIVFKNWSCDTFNLSGYNTNDFIIEFEAADCSLGGHYGYVYLADQCKDCNKLPIITLDSIKFNCVSYPLKITGKLNYDSTYEMVKIELQVFSGGISRKHLYQGGNYYNDQTKIFTFQILKSDLIELDSLCCDIYAIATLINPFGDTITIRSTSIIPNNSTKIGVDNDICFSLPDCCTIDTITMGAAWQYCLLGQGYENAHLVSSGTINSNQIPSGYSICGFKPGDFEGATIDYISSSTYGGNFEYEIGIMVTDWTKLRANAGNYYFLGYWKLCRGTDTCEVPVKLMIFSSQTMCSWSYGLMCSNFKFIPTPITIYSDGKGNSCVGVQTYFPFDHNPGGMKEDSCTITSYNVTFKLLRNNAVPYTLLTTTVYPDQNPGIKKFATALCWPTSWNSNVTGWQMEFTNNCGGSCTMVQNKPAAFGGDTGSSIFNHNMTGSIDKLMVSPNPASSLVNASWNINSTPERMAIIDYSGKVIYSERILDQSGEKELNVGNLKAGNYHLTIFYTDGRSISTAFMIGK